MKSYPFTAKLVEGEYDRIITSALEREFNKQKYTNGIFSVPTNGLQVTADTGMSVNVGIGGCNIEGAQAYNESILPIVLSASNASLARIDRIVVRFDLDDLIRSIEIYKKEGTFSSTPVAPSIYTESNYYELVLADIYVPAGATEIVASNITDQRLNSALCGLVIPAIPTAIDTTDLYDQYQDSLDTWLAVVDAAINETLAGQLQTNIDANTADIATNTAELEPIQKYTTATAVTNGDFQVDLLGIDTLAIGDVVKVSFPSATDNTKDARLSIDGGTNYKNIYINGIQVKAKSIQGKNLSLRYDGTQFNVDSEELYSTSEVKTNKVWVDGKPLYRKSVYASFGYEMTNTITITNADYLGIITEASYIRAAENTTLGTMGWYGGGTNYVRVYVDGDTINVIWGATYESFPEKNALFTVLYTKTTD